MFCLATYNIWNSMDGMPSRENYVMDELKAVHPDVVCLQEVRDASMAGHFAAKLNMGHFFSNYPGEQEGLCIFSKGEIILSKSWLGRANAIFAIIRHHSKRIAIVNVHLPWDSALEREKMMGAVLEGVKEMNSDYLFLLGDFNCSASSDIQRMLLGDSTLHGIEANPCFFDLALSYAALTGRKAKDTLDFRKNPRFTGNTIETNQRFDRIMLRNTYPDVLPVLLESDIFGEKIYEDIHLSASDHYGVYARMELTGN